MSDAVSILIPVFNNPSDTRVCLDGILASTAANRTDFQIIVCDDASDERATIDYLTGLGDRIQLLRNEQNLGYTRSANRLLAAAKSDHAVLMNNDCVVRDDWLDPLVARLVGDPRLALVGTRARLGRGNDGKPTPVMVMFECVGINMSAVRKEGPFDERFAPAYYEDDDYNVRVLLAGYRIDVIAEPKVAHEIPARSYGAARRLELMRTNARKFIDKWGQHPQVALYIRHVLFNPFTWKVGFSADDIAQLRGA